MKLIPNYDENPGSGRPIPNEEQFAPPPSDDYDWFPYPEEAWPQ